jgi:phosphonate transport system permease protein
MMGGAKPKNGLFARWRSLWGLLLLVLLMVVPASVLHVSATDFFSGRTWQEMADLVIRLGPYDRITRCKDAQLVWGNADSEGPWSGHLDPERVAAVCDRGEKQYWFRPDFLKDQIAYVSQIKSPLVETFQMAIVGTAIGSLLAVPLALYSAANLARNRAVYFAVRTVMSVIRTIPDLVLAALLAGAFGIGALPGIMALGIFSMAIVAKLLSESIEAIDPGPLEAIQATGGNWVQQIAYGVWPQIVPQFMGYVLYVLEVNVRASTVLGYVGAGGIGQVLYTNLNLGQFRQVGVVVVVMLAVVIIMDWISNALRERLV